MSAEEARGLTPEQDRPSYLFGDRLEADRTYYCEPILLWDEIAKKWPKERFPIFISVNHSA